MYFICFLLFVISDFRCCMCVKFEVLMSFWLFMNCISCRKNIIIYLINFLKEKIISKVNYVLVM